MLNSQTGSSLIVHPFLIRLLYLAYNLSSRLNPFDILLEQSGIPREEIFITTKVQAGAHTVEGCKRKVEKSLNDLGLGES
jgi:hypothetical protein